MGGRNRTKTTINAPNNLGDFKLQSTSYGKTIPKVWGQTRIEGNVTKLEGFRGITDVEVITTPAEGKGGIIDYSRNYTYTFAASLEIALCEILSYPKNIGWVWEQNRKTRAANGPFREGLVEDNRLFKIQQEYKMGTKPNLPNFSFEINGSTGDEEWEEIYQNDGGYLKEFKTTKGQSHFAAANDKYLGAAFVGGYNNANDDNKKLTVIGEKLTNVINGVGGHEEILNTVWDVPQSELIYGQPKDTYIVKPPQTSIVNEFLYILVEIEAEYPTSSLYESSVILLTYNLLTSKFDEKLINQDITNKYSITADEDFLFIFDLDYYSKAIVRAYDIKNGFPTYLSSVNIRNRIGDLATIETLFITNNNGKLFILADMDSITLIEYYYPADALSKKPNFLQAPDYPNDNIELIDFVSDGENLGALINLTRDSDSGEKKSVAIAYRRASGTVEYYTLADDVSDFFSAQYGSLTITNGYLAAYITTGWLNLNFISELAVNQDGILETIVSDEYIMDSQFNHYTYQVINENWKGGFLIAVIDGVWNRSEVKIYARPEHIYDVYPTEIIEDFLTTDNGLDLSNLTNVDVSKLHTYCENNLLQVSMALVERRTAFDIIKELLLVSNGVVRIDENLDLQFLPYHEYTTPIISVTEDDLLGPIVINRVSPESRPSGVRIEFSNRDIEYNSDVFEKHNESIETYENIIDHSLKSITRTDVAGKIAGLQLKRNAFINNLYQLSLPIKFITILPGDFIKLNSLTDNIINQKLYVKETTENDTSVDIVCEEYVEYINSPGVTPEYESKAERVDLNVSPGKPTIKLFKQDLDIVIIAVGGSLYWGGCRVFVSDDNGHNYNMIGSINYNNFIGKVTSYNYPKITVSPTTSNIPAQTGYVVLDGGKWNYDSYTVNLEGIYEFNLTNQPLIRPAINEYMAVATQYNNKPLSYSIPAENSLKTLLFKVEGRNTFNTNYQNIANITPVRYGGHL